MRTRLGLLAVVLGAVILGGSWWLVASDRVSLTTGAQPSASAAAVKLPPCIELSALPRVPVQPAWEQVVTDYYSAKGMTVTGIAPTATLLDAEQQRIGLHRCLNPDGGEGAWTGAVPEGAIAALQLQVTHDPYPVTGGSFSFVTLAGDGATWSVVAEGTGP